MRRRDVSGREVGGDEAGGEGTGGGQGIGGGVNSAGRSGGQDHAAGPLAPLAGLVLAGGRSRRMQQDKALLRYRDGRSQLELTFALLQVHCASVYVSVRRDQVHEPERARFPQIVDLADLDGPAAGIRAAQVARPDAAWLVVACDLPFLDEATLAHLVRQRHAAADATAYASTHDGLPEPLCAVWEPSSAGPLAALLAAGRNCPRKALLRMHTRLLRLPQAHALDNANTPDDRARIASALAGGAAASDQPRRQAPEEAR